MLNGKQITGNRIWSQQPVRKVKIGNRKIKFPMGGLNWFWGWTRLMEDVAHMLHSPNDAVFKLFLTGLLNDFRHAEQCGRQMWLITIRVAWVGTRGKVRLYPPTVGVFETAPINRIFPRPYNYLVVAIHEERGASVHLLLVHTTGDAARHRLLCTIFILL